MHSLDAIGATVLAAVLAMTVGATAQDAAKYPDWSGQWRRAESGPNRYDPNKPPGRAQEAPLTPEYRAIYEASLADQAAGGQGNNPSVRCIPRGMPGVMTFNQPSEFAITPDVTYVMFSNNLPRRIYTDGRGWPAEGAEAGFSGYSIGKWLDTDADGRFDTLEVETRNIKGPRSFDNQGTPTHKDNQTVVNERIYLDQADKDLLHNDITTIDHALTRPWTVNKTYRRQTKTAWVDNICGENNNHVEIGGEQYLAGADGRLMPTRKDQPPPDLRYFNQPRR
jgi:hypothetical protein